MVIHYLLLTNLLKLYLFTSAFYSEVTEGALQVWRALPERIRQDPSLASFRQEHERLHGKFADENLIKTNLKYVPSFFFAFVYFWIQFVKLIFFFV